MVVLKPTADTNFEYLSLTPLSGWLYSSQPPEQILNTYPNPSQWIVVLKPTTDTHFEYLFLTPLSGRFYTSQPLVQILNTYL